MRKFLKKKLSMYFKNYKINSSQRHLIQWIWLILIPILLDFSLNVSLLFALNVGTFRAHASERRRAQPDMRITRDIHWDETRMSDTWPYINKQGLCVYCLIICRRDLLISQPEHSCLKSTCAASFSFSFWTPWKNMCFTFIIAHRLNGSEMLAILIAYDCRTHVLL